MEVELRTLAWSTALATWGIGDLATTAYGIEETGAVEENETGQAVIKTAGYGGMVAWKALTFGAFYGLESIVPKPHSIGVPIGLSILGVGTLANNINVITKSEKQMEER